MADCIMLLFCNVVLTHFSPSKIQNGTVKSYFPGALNFVISFKLIFSTFSCLFLNELHTHDIVHYLERNFVEI